MPFTKGSDIIYIQYNGTFYFNAQLHSLTAEISHRMTFVVLQYLIGAKNKNMFIQNHNYSGATQTPTDLLFQTLPKNTLKRM